MKSTSQFTKLISLSILAPLLTACALMSGRETAGEYVDDTTVTSRVKSAIFQDPNLKASQIHVETFQGEVQLSGFIDSLAEKMKANEIARKTQGVKAVKDNLVVR